MPRFITGPKDKDIVHWVCDIHPDIYKMIVNKRLYLSYSVCKVSEYINITICNKCQKYGHIAAKYIEDRDTCAYCAGIGHRMAVCPNKDKEPTCKNCGGPFTARHKVCSYRISRVRLMVRNTDYGYQ